MDILFTGNLMPLSNSFYGQLGREKKLVICGKSAITEYQSRRVTPYNYEEGRLESLFKTFHFQAVVYFSKALDGTKKVFDELENLENIVYLCSQYKVKNLIYVTTNDLAMAHKEMIDKEGSRYILLSACEHLCRNICEKEALDISIVRIPYLYNNEPKGTQLASWIQAAVFKGELNLPGKSSEVIDFLWDEDLARLIDRMIDEPHRGYLEMNVGGEHAIRFFDLAQAFSKQLTGLKVGYLNYEVAIPRSLKEDMARDEFGWFPLGDFLEQLRTLIAEEMARKNQKKRGRLLDNHPQIKSTLITAVELVLFFLLVEFLEAKSSDNPLLSFMDYRLLFVVIMGALRGLNVGIFAAVLASFGYVTNSLVNANWQIVFYNPQNWLPFATYFLVGAVTGYAKDKAEDTIRFLKEEQEILEKKYVFLNELYIQTLDNKDEFSSQIISYKDSYGKIYSAVRKLASILPEQVFYEAVNVLEDILDNPHVAIYSVERNSDFARLNVCSRSLREGISKSMRLSDYRELDETIRSHETWVNTACIPDYPAYAAPIFREDRMVGLITVYDVSTLQLSQEYHNKLSIVSGLIQEFLVRAIERSELIERDTMIAGTKIMKAEAFAEIAAIKRQMKEKKFSEYMMIRLKHQERSPQDLSNKLVRLLRNNDVIGRGSDGETYVLLSQTSDKYVSIIEKRMGENKIYFEIVNP